MKLKLNIYNSLIQGFYWVFYAAMLSFASVYLLGKGYSNSSIGIILAAGNALALVLQPLLSNFSDRTQRFTLPQVMIMPSLALLIMTAIILCINSKSAVTSLLFITVIGGLMGIQSMINGFSFYLERTGYRVNFGICRAIGGALIYALGTYVIGIYTEKSGENFIPVTGIFSIAFLILLLLVVHVTTKNINREKNIKEEIRQIPFKEFLANNKLFFIFSIGIGCIYFGHAVQNTFTIQIITNVGGDSADMGKILTFMAFCEIPGLALYSTINKKLSSKTLLKISTAGFLIKIILMYTAKSIFMIYVAHFFQMFGLGLFLPAIVHFIQEVMETGEAIRGQAVYPLMVTAATIISSFTGGIIIDKFGISFLLLICTFFTVIGSGIMVFLVGKIKKK